MVRSNLENKVARMLYEGHGIVTFPCVDEAADLETISGLCLEVKRGRKRAFQADRHGNLMEPAPLDLYFDDDYALSCPLTSVQREGSFDYLVMWTKNRLYVLEWDEIAPLIYKPMLYIPCRYLQALEKQGTDLSPTRIAHEEILARHKKLQPFSSER